MRTTPSPLLGAFIAAALAATSGAGDLRLPELRAARATPAPAPGSGGLSLDGGLALAGTALHGLALARAVPGAIETLSTAPDLLRSDPGRLVMHGVDAYARKQVGFGVGDVETLRTMVQESPQLGEMADPLDPGNIALTVGIQAGTRVLGDIASGKVRSPADTLEILGDGEFWGGVAGATGGYTLVSMVATSLLPGGAGLVPMLAPSVAGMTGSMVGWKVGEGSARGKTADETLASMDLVDVVGRSTGSTVGMLAGANVAAGLGGALGSVGGPVGMVAGAMILGPMGATLATGIRDRLLGDEEGYRAAMARTREGVANIRQGSKDLALALPVLTGTPGAPLTGAARERAYLELTEALVRDERLRAARALASMAGR